MLVFLQMAGEWSPSDSLHSVMGVTGAFGGWARTWGTGDATLSLGPAGSGHQGTCPVRVRVVYGQLVSFSRGGENLTFDMNPLLI